MPYHSLPEQSFWKLCRRNADFSAPQIYKPKFELSEGTAIATAGSCFAQHIGRYVQKSSLNLLQVEPGPDNVSKATLRRYGYGVYSARYGNIYTARQFRQLIEDTINLCVHEEAIWEKNGRFYDALRPSVEPKGLSCEKEVVAQRMDHLRRLYSMFKQTEVLVFTLGLTEYWQGTETGIAFPTCPGVMAGQYDARHHSFRNASYGEVLDDLQVAFSLLRSIREDIKFLLTVSPVPLAATATGEHVLSANSCSKSKLRAVAGELAENSTYIDYFPSYELITGAPFSGRFFSQDLRSVTEVGVEFVMDVFFAAHKDISINQHSETTVSASFELADDLSSDLICEEHLYESFAART